MPLTKVKLANHIAEFSGPVTKLEIARIAADPHIRVVQTIEPVELKTADLLDAELFSSRPDIVLRVYGFYCHKYCDLSFVARMQNLRRFSADCLTLPKVAGVESVAELPKLEDLSIGIYGLESFEFLSDLPREHLRRLSLGLTKSKKPSLRPIERFKNLTTLALEAQQKDIDAISSLTKLADLELRSITLAGLDFLENLKQLSSLDIKLGGTSDLSAIAGMKQIKYLELWQIKGMRDISVVSTLGGLQFLFLQSLPHIGQLPDLSKLKSLRRIHLETMKGLKSISALAKAPAIEEIMHVAAKGIEPGDYAGILKNKSLRRVSVFFGSVAKNNAFRDMVASAGKAEFSRSEFAFR